MSMHANFDYNLIKTLVLVFETKSMRKAAQTLGVSAPTLTYSLNKIRDYYNDPLFTKTAHGFKATPLARELYTLFKRIDEEIQSAVTFNDGKKYNTRNMIIRTNNGIELFLMEHLLDFGGAGEGVNFNFNNRILSDDQRIGALISRETDIDIGTIIRAENSLIGTLLFKSKLVALCSSHHPRLDGAINDEQWLAEEHAMVSVIEGGSYWSAEVNELLMQRKIRYRTMSLINVFHCLETSEMIMIIPEYFTLYIKDRFALKSVEIPLFNDVELSIYAYIHRRAKDDDKLKMIVNLLKEN